MENLGRELNRRKRDIPQKATSPEKNHEVQVGSLLSGPHTSTNFEGSKIFTFRKGGERINYALRRDSAGALEGNSFKVLTKQDGMWQNFGANTPNYGESGPNTMIGPTQQLPQSDLDAIETLLKSKGMEI